MKLVINTQTNTIIGSVEGVAEALLDTVYLDPPEGFDMELAAEWSFGGGVLTHDPLIALNRAKTARKAGIKTEAAELITALDWKLARAKEREAAGWSGPTDVLSVLAQRESVRRSSTAAEAAVDALSDAGLVQRFVWGVDVVVEVVDPAEWLIDIGPFYDRFGPAKSAVINSVDAGVLLIFKDLSPRKWIDLADPKVASAVQYIGSVIALVTPTLRSAILTVPVAPLENLALRKLYFS